MSDEQKDRQLTIVTRTEPWCVNYAPLESFGKFIEQEWVECSCYHDADGKCLRDKQATEGYRLAIEEVEKRQKAEASRHYWRYAAISAWIVLLVNLARWWFGW